MPPPDTMILRAEVHSVDRCPVLTRVKTFLGQQGVRNWVEHQFLNRQGTPINLSELTPMASGSLSATLVNGSLTEPVESPIVVCRLREPLVTLAYYGNDPIYEEVCEVIDPETGLVRFRLPKEIVEKAGLYMLSFAVQDEQNEALLVSNAVLSVEHNYYAGEPFIHQHTHGPPSVSEIRMHMMDSSPNENLLLDDVEFGADQIVDAILKPIRYWNEAPPPLGDLDTRGFAYRHNWLDAIVGHLFVTAAHNYRRNHLAYQAGGNAVDDKNKEGPYLAAGQALLQGWKDFVLNKKVELNVKQFYGAFGSPYGG